VRVFQGSILGLLLFLCHINDIFGVSSLAIFLFADDATRLAENKILQDLISCVNVELYELILYVLRLTSWREL
jgi:hypothetical protein